MTHAEAREQYPVCARYAYLNAGTFGPLSRATAEAVANRRREDVERGRGGAAYFGWMREARERVRRLLADEIGVPAQQLALTRSTTESCNLVLNGLGLAPDDEVVTTDVEHFGLLAALACSGARVRVAAVRERPAAAALDAILGEVGPRTRLIGLSHVAWSTGHVLPVEELREATDVPLLIDGAQSAGAMAVAAGRFDFYTVSAQKWLCTPDSLGGLYVADPDNLRVTFPSYFSQDGYRPDGSFEPQQGALRFDTGWIAPGLLAGAEAAIGGHPDWRFDCALELARRCRDLVGERFELITEPEHATLVTFRVAGDPEEIVARLFDRGIVVRDLPGTDWVRASCGYWNDESDLERLVEALAA